MIEPTCAEVCDAAPEYALDILEPSQRAVITAHLTHCPACRTEVESMFAVGARLLELIPGTEPPLGFDRRVLARVRGLNQRQGWAGWAARSSPRLAGRRPRLIAGIAAVAASAAIVFGSLGWFAGRTSAHHGNQVVLAAAFHEGSRNVGEVSVLRTYDGPTWLSMTVRDASGAGQVQCELVDADGTVKPIGSFALVAGSGSWTAPDWGGTAGVSGARLVGPDGTVIATATFR